MDAQRRDSSSEEEEEEEEWQWPATTVSTTVQRLNRHAVDAASVIIEHPGLEEELLEEENVLNESRQPDVEIREV